MIPETEPKTFVMFLGNFELDPNSLNQFLKVINEGIFSDSIHKVIFIFTTMVIH